MIRPIHRLLLLLIVCAFPLQGLALEVPALRARVNDYAGMFSAETAQQLESRLKAIESSDSTQVVVLTVPSLQGEVLEEFSIRVADAWKIGRKGKDNGVIILIARDERKIRIEVGRGLQGTLTDLVAGRIIRHDMIPAFKKKDYDRGIQKGINAIEKTVRGEYTADTRKAKKTSDSGIGLNMLLYLLVPVFFIVSALSRKSKLLGGITGGIAAPALVWFAFPALALFVYILVGIAGFIIGLLMGIITGRGSGGFWGGGGSYSSGGIAEVFSGLGGIFDGGGASGDW